MKARIVLICVFSIMIHLNAFAATGSDKLSVPPSLEPWKGWVLHGQDDLSCPRVYNTGDVFRCIWPSRLRLEMKNEGGRFFQQWLVFKDGMVPLPGSAKTWPQDVRADGKPIPVVEVNGIPTAFMKKGEHNIEGSFIWNEMPVTLKVPETSGLVKLLIDGKEEESPLIDKEGRIWLQERKQTEVEENRLDVKVYRLLNDSIPMQITTDFKLNVSGQARNIKLEKPLLDGFIPMDITSPIPARLSDEGLLIVQARPGTWDIRITARSPGPVHEISFGPVPYGQEVWAFQAQNHLRMVKIEGAASIDPGQTGLPSDWKTLPAFVIQGEKKLVFKEIRRGDPDPAPDRLNLERTWWLDFDGTGYTIHDRIHGTMNRNWYIAMNPPVNLGRVSVDGVDQLITSHGKDEKRGVELRRGRLRLQADSRIEAKTGTLPAVGWDHDFRSLSGSLNLPPGWLLVRASGVDVMPGSWFERWSLLDLFLVLIITLAVFKLWNWKWCLVAFFTLAFTFQEPGGPRMVWLHLLAASALWRFLPESWFRKLVRLWKWGAAVALLIIVIPFALQQVRWGIYPQLEPARAPLYRHGQITTGALQTKIPAPQEGIGAGEMAETEDLKAQVPVKKSYGLRKEKYADTSRQEVDYALVQDPNALIQTGPGLPAWKWRTFSMKWNGPVNRDQEIRLWLLPPSAKLIFAFVKVLLLALFVFILLDMRRWKLRNGSVALAFVVLFLLLHPGMAWSQTQSGDFPPQSLLDQLRERLMEKPDCLPMCADSPRMKVDMSPGSLKILFDIHAAAEAALPLPGSSDYWRSGEILMDGKPAKGLTVDNENRFWILAEEGIHRVLMTANISGRNALQVNMPLKPHRVSVESNGWDVQGVDKNGHVEGSIKFIRRRTETLPEISGSEVPPFLGVTRVISLGLEWRVQTTVTRLTRTGSPVVVKIPLIKGESVTTSGIKVENGFSLVQMDPGTTRVSWESTLEQETPIQLRAPESVPWTEIWVLDSSPIWHCAPSGIPVTHNRDRSGNWKPQWNPWPGEEVSIQVSRPKAVPGRIKTIDRVWLTLTPGDRFGNAALALNVKSSQGGQHSITLPEGARIQKVMIKGIEQPVNSNDREVILPLQPGTQSVDILWNEDMDSLTMIRSPRVELGEEAVNADVVFEMPRNRWILATFGPRMGPAVLFWSYLFVILVAAVGLGRIPWAPLKTRHWILLGLGLTQVHPLVAMLVVSWLLALGLRKKYTPDARGFLFNMSQVLLVMWTSAAMIGLYAAIQTGLLGIPGMQVTGNGSHNFLLHWTQDRITGTTPHTWVLSLPMLVFRILMLLWALWLAFSLLKWFRWGWQCFSEGGLWRKISFRKKKTAVENVSPDPEKG